MGQVFLESRKIHGCYAKSCSSELCKPWKFATRRNIHNSSAYRKYRDNRGNNSKRTAFMVCKKEQIVCKKVEYAAEGNEKKFLQTWSRKANMQLLMEEARYDCRKSNDYGENRCTDHRGNCRKFARNNHVSHGRERHGEYSKCTWIHEILLSFACGVVYTLWRKKSRGMGTFIF